jgi:hypothetical protein
LHSCQGKCILISAGNLEGNGIREDLQNGCLLGKYENRTEEQEKNLMELNRHTIQIRCREAGISREIGDALGRNAGPVCFAGPVRDEGKAAETAFTERTGRQKVSPTAYAREEGSVTVGSSAVSIRRAVEFAMPSLRGKKIGILTVLPAIPPTQVSLRKRSHKEDLQQPVESPRELPRVVEIPQAVPVKVIPEAGAKTRRAAKPREEASPAIATKPLKVIRRRREEAPKVFETAPMPVPEAMLAGAKASDNDAADGLD